jgi:hypothetical protein
MCRTGALLLMTILCLGSAVSAQWIAQESNLPADVRAYRICAVDENVVWAAGFIPYWAPCRSFTRTLDGGMHWQAGIISVPEDTSLFIANISAHSADTAWAAIGSWDKTQYAGIYNTTDGGASWQQQTTAFPFPGIGPSFVYFFNAREGLTVGWEVRDGYMVIYTTIDSGVTWEPIAEANRVPAQPEEAPNFASFSVCGDDLYTDTYGKVMVTRDKGKSWQRSSSFATGYGWPSFQDRLNGISTVVLGSMAYPMVLTRNGGTAWEAVISPDISAYYSAAIPGTARGYLVTGGLWNLRSPGSAFTLDHGNTWTIIDRAEHLHTELLDRNQGWGGDGSSNKIYKWQIGPEAAIGRYPLTDLVFPLTKLGGRSFAQSVSITNYGQAPLVISEIIPGANSGLLLSYDLPKTINSLESAPIELFFAPKTEGVESDSVVIVSNAANCPRLSFKLAGEGMAIEPAQAGLLYAVSATSLYTIDPISAKATLIGPTTLTNLHGLAIDPATRELTASSTLTASSSYYAIHSTAATSIILQTVPVGNIRAIAFKSDTLYGATPNGKLYRLDLAAAEAALLGTATGVYYHSIAVQPATGILYGSMQASSGSIKDRIVTINPANGDTTLVGATGDGLATPSIAFSPSGVLYGLKGTGTTVNTLITIDPKNGAATLVGSTGVSGLRALAWAPGTNSVDEPLADYALPGEFALLQNYPNPFNSKTVISFSIPRAEHVRIIIFDILGREAAVLADGPYSTGMHKIALDASSFSSGIYFYQMTAGQFSQMRKLAVLE